MLKPIYRGGLLLPDFRLWFDPRKRKPFAVVLHAHGDHVANHDCYLAPKVVYTTTATKRISPPRSVAEAMMRGRFLKTINWS